MKGFVQKGDVLTLVAPAALASGEGFMVGSIFGVAQDAALQNAAVEAGVEGVFDVAKAAVEVAVGEPAYFDAGNKVVTNLVGASNKRVGVFVGAATAGAATGRVRLQPSTSAVADKSYAELTDGKIAAGVVPDLSGTYAGLTEGKIAAGVVPDLSATYQPAGDYAELVAKPAAANSTGVAGQMAYEDGYLYICIATDTWQRVQIATWGG